jgi:XTP/dITP diphosphohydrolase
MEKLHDALVKAGAQEAGDRRARFIAVLCLAWPDGHAEFYRGEVAGHLVWPPRGSKGMGFDPIFQPDGHGRTFGEMEAQEKRGWDAGSGDDGLSHRARAFSRFAHARLGANK